MDNKEKLDILIDFKIGGEEELNKIFSTISDGLDSERLKTEAAKVQAVISSTMDSIKKSLDQGKIIDLKSSGIFKASKDLSSFLDKIGDKVGSAHGDQVIQAFDEKIRAAQDRVIRAQENMDRIDAEILAKRNQLQRDLMQGAFGKKFSPDLIDNTDKLIDDLKEIQTEISKLESEGKKTKGLREQEAALIAVSEAIKKMNKESTTLRKSRGGHTSQKTQGLGIIQEEGMKKQKYLSEFNGEVDEATKSMNKLSSVAEYFRNLITTGELQKATKDMDKLNKATEDAERDTKKLSESVKAVNKSFSRRIFEGISYYTIFNKIKQLWSTSIAIVQDLDRAMTDAAIVTNMTQKETWGLLQSYQSLADEVGRSASEIASLNAFFLQQGLNIKNAMEMTEVAAKSAAIAGISLQESANYITSAINGFGLAASAAKDVADKFAAVGAATAADFEELAIAMSKVAPVAQSAGVGIDFMMGVLAKGIHTTREAPENIGTAFKTIFARMSELTDIGKSMEDGMSLNRVEKALNSVGIALRDDVGQFRDLENVLYEVGFAWKNLDSLQQNYLATALAGTRQQPRLMAILNDFEETVEFIEISKDSAKAMEYQHMEYMQGMEAASQGVRNAWERLVTSVLDSDIIIGILKAITGTLNVVSKVLGILNNTFVKFGLLVGIATVALVMFSKTATALPITATKGTASLYALGNAFKNLTGTIWGAITAAAEFMLAYLPLVIIAAVIVGIGAAIFAVNKYMKAQNELVKQNNKLMYESKQRDKELQDKVKEYEKLQKQIHKTNEELERMKELESELSEFDGIDGKTQNFMKRSSDGSMVIDYDELTKNFAKEEARRKKLDGEIRKQLRDSQSEVASNAAYQRRLNEDPEEITKFIEENLTSDFNRFGENLQAQGYQTGEKYIEGLLESSQITKSQAADLNKKIARVMDNATMKMFTDKDGILSFEAAEEFGENIAKILSKNISKPNEDFDPSSVATVESLTKRLEDYQQIMKEIEDLGLGIDETRDIKLNVSASFEDENALMLFQKEGIELDIISKFIDEGGKLSELQVLAKTIGVGSNTNHEAEEKRRKEIQDEFAALQAREDDAEWYLDRQINNFLRSNKKGERYYEKNMAEVMAEREALQRELDAMSTEQERAIDQGLSAQQKSALLTGQNMEENIAAARKALMETGMSAVEANEYLQDNVLRFISNDNALDISNYGKTISSTFQNALKLDEDLLKGDFTSYINLVDELGENGVELVEDFMEKNKPDAIIKALDDGFKKKIEKRRDILKGQLIADAVEGSAAYRENKKIDKELAQLDIMESSYQNINQLTAIYNKNLEDANNALGVAKNIYKDIESMLEAGFSENSPMVGFLKGIADTLQKEAEDLALANIENIFNNIAEERQKLFEEDIMNEEGQFYNTPKAKRYKANFEELLAQGAEAVQQASNIVLAKIEENNKEFSKRIKESNEEYKKLMDSIKSMHSERWNEINYENQLIDLQRNITKARNELAQSQMLGNKKQIQEASESLRRLQQERRKAIEDEMMSRLEKRIEEDRKEAEDALEKEKLTQNQALIETMEKNTSSIDGLNDTMTKIKKEPIAMAPPTEGSKKPSKPKTGDLNQEYAIAGYLPGGSFR